MKLSKEEKKIIIEKRKKEESYKPKKVGFLKEDLYAIDNGRTRYEIELPGSWYFNSTERDIIIKDFSSKIKLVVCAGTKFECYLDDGAELWYDTVYGIEAMSKQWAEKYLRDIENIKKKK